VKREDRDNSDNYPLPTTEAIDNMASFAEKFKTEQIVTDEVHLDTGAPVPCEPSALQVHPAAQDFFKTMTSEEWILKGWDYSSWSDEYADVFRSPEWIATLSLRDIQKWLTYYSRELRWTSLCVRHSITIDIEAGVLPAVLDRLIHLRDKD